MDADEILRGIDFPNNKWRKQDKGNLVNRDRVIGIIKKMQTFNVPVPVIRDMVGELYWGAFVEHELQVKEVTGRSVQAFLEAKLASNTSEVNKDVAASDLPVKV